MNNWRNGVSALPRSRDRVVACALPAPHRKQANSLLSAAGAPEFSAAGPRLVEHAAVCHFRTRCLPSWRRPCPTHCAAAVARALTSRPFGKSCCNAPGRSTVGVGAARQPPCSVSTAQTDYCRHRPPVRPWASGVPEFRSALERRLLWASACSALVSRSAGHARAARNPGRHFAQP